MFYPARTALKRKKPSRPAVDFILSGPMGEVRPHAFVLDWGCGKGRDVDWYNNLGLDSKGYDPYWRPLMAYKSPEPKFNYITCFYVLNVIPTKRERAETIKQAVGHLAKDGKMFIAVRSKTEVDYAAKKWKKFRDGYKTSRDTFQRGFTNEELKAIVKKAGLYYTPWSKSGYIGCIVTKP